MPPRDTKPIAYANPRSPTLNRTAWLASDHLSSVFLSRTRHAVDKPVHLKLKDSALPLALNLPVYAEPAQR